MKKIVVVAVALSLGAATVSCKKGLDKIGNAVRNVGNNNAQDIIDFNNDFLDSYKSSRTNIQSVVKYADAALEKAKGGEVRFMPIVIGTSDYYISRIKEVPSGFDRDKAALEADFKVYKSKKESLQNNYEALKSYIASEDYKDDKGAKAEALKKSIEADALAIFSAAEDILVKIKPATDKAEEAVLKNHPMKEYIISSKAVMDAMDASMDILNTQYEEGFSQPEAQKKYDALAQAIENNTKKEFDVKDSRYSNKKTQYESFNRNASDFLGNFRKLIRDSKDTGTIADSNISSMDTAYESVLNSYNNFVK